MTTTNIKSINMIIIFYYINNIFANLIINITEIFSNFLLKFSATNINFDSNYNSTDSNNNNSDNTNNSENSNNSSKEKKSRTSKKNKYPVQKPKVKLNGAKGAPTKAEKAAHVVAIEKWTADKIEWEKNNSNSNNNNENKDDDKPGPASGGDSSHDSF